MTTPISSGTNSGGGHLTVSGVVKAFGEQTVLRDVSLTVRPGSTTAIVGPSGAGKTTLLRVIAGFERPGGGVVDLDGTVLAGDGRWVPPHQRAIGYVAQDGALFPHLSVGQNIAFGMESASGRAGKAQTRARVDELLEMVSLDPSLARRGPHEISGGQQQRVALARALAREPQLLLLDESFSSLDAGLRVATRRAVAAVLERAGVTTILVTHDQGEALSFADQVAVIRDGSLTQVSAPMTVYQQPADLGTAEFLGEAVVLDAWVEGTVARSAFGDLSVRADSPQGRVRLMLRPEQVRVVDDGPISATVVSTEFYGPEVIVRFRLEPDVVAGAGNGHTAAADFTVRHWEPAGVRVGAQLKLRVFGDGVAYPSAQA
ncbi:iron(III) ABC transporter, ATP-binding protein [Janibacter sp. HTCC2649]|uniref:ABC transporter ATP-binding protein n=1 Tax=Janibacter sp. HTCC2649 TaxID=313589 RepID=UPI0000670A9E|nr:ABC transporter ATP-binding protein [Janibacter sp. HTCC2649]EAQ00464.1 iron(III) ABC transporter, ATP-binding protein [Janibacter sp. HTCC2649]